MNNERRPIILIVDDVAANRIALKRLLRHMDADLVEAESGEEALVKAVGLKRLSLILLDVQMPIMDGYETAELLREERQTRHIPIIFITAVHRDESQILKGYTSGAIDYITKPIEPAILVAKISLFMELWRLRFGLEQEIQMRSQLEVENRFLAEHDPLTNLANRHCLFTNIESAIAVADRKKNGFALLFVDLDGFKLVNDSLGQKFGDKVLITIAGRFAELIRQTDTVARIGGDEFVILLTDVCDATKLSGRINQILIAAKEKIAIQGEEVSLGASIGVCVYPDQKDNAEKLLYFAEIAMNKAKNSGENSFRFFSVEMDEVAHKRTQVERLLRHAIVNNELDIHFQPLVCVDTSLPVGAEVLLRWTNPELGSISPEYFIPIAESIGLIYEIGAWVLDQSISRFEELQHSSEIDNDLALKFAINASALQFRNNELHQILQTAIDDQRILPEQLEIEITEGLLLEDSDEVTQQLHAISELGVSLSIDDFGTGYSSLSYLKRCPIKTVKIDRSFISGVPKSKEDIILIRTIIAMAHGLEFQVIAEGVESEDQLDYLKKEDCDLAQGYYISKPVPFEQFKLWLIEHQHLYK
ncbi:MAG: EAL domain-containing protein [Pseudomonadales bacterium]